MVQPLRALTALPEDLGSVPSTHMVAHNQFQWTQLPLLASKDTRHASGTDTHASKTLICILKTHPKKPVKRRCLHQIGLHQTGLHQIGL